ncbi:Conserved_hypothetical protein [Hexamita inflata]|uniref:Uncharacterized protein n=1 Tax=Hexamita inflata TaxID=28002 RepID=A0AA86UJI1_9EUKA|nr:Conserved hypothetical protein [Hexamita inflata]
MINEKFIICSGSQVFDLKSKNCITRDQCFEKLDQFTFQSTCVLQCPKNYYIFNQTCFQTCPQYLGAYKSSGNICQQAPSLYYASQETSVQICSQFIFKKGCYTSCPSGTAINGQNCLEPVIVSNCQDGEYLVLTGQTDARFYNQCTKLAPVWMYRDIDKQNKALGTYKDTCSSVIGLNNDCQEFSSPYQKNNGLCQIACASGQYQQSSTQACNDCLSTIYDGGLILDPNGNKCTTLCIKYTLSGTRKICQDNFPENCPFWKVISVGQYRQSVGQYNYLCQDSCLNNQFTDGQVCSSCDPSKNQVADKINGGCKCVTDYFIKKLPDGSIKCTECDTSLRLQDSKVNGECICLEGQVWEVNRCKSNCLPTQVYLPEATSCSYCTSSELVPNLNQDECVPKTSCSPGFLNLAGTFCIVSCFDGSAFYNQQSQCVTCASIDALSQFSVNSCVCVLGASKATLTSQCSCNTGFSTQANSCECSKKITADASVCADTCPESEVSIDDNIRCQTCSNQVPNVGQTACVAKTACSPGFLNIAQIKCISNCALDKAGAGLNNQCLQCQIINPLSIFKTTSCECTSNAVGSGTACTCNIANGFKAPDCSCSQKLSSNGTFCSEKCPSTEVFLPNTIQCSKCQINQIPNLNQDACVPKTSCSPGFLNLAGTFCIVSCFDESAFYNQQSQCVTCASIDALSQFSVNSCVCVLGASKATLTSQCSCNTGFSTQANSCECSKKITADASVCADTCPESEVSIDDNIRCQTCSNQVPNVGQTACVAKTACSPGFLNIAQIKCISNCALDKAGAGLNNQCLQCQIINPLSIFKTTSCECTSNAVGSGTACTCNIANGFKAPDCSCSQKLSSNGTFCSEKCPSTEVFLPNTIQCSKCQINQIPNLNQDACENTLCKVDQFVYERRCYDQCPPGTTKTRLQTCIKDCKIFDQYPNQMFCETAGDQNCQNIRKQQANIYTCTLCTFFEFYDGFECVQNCDQQFVSNTNKIKCVSSCGSYPKGYTQEIYNLVSVNVCYDKCPPDLPDYDTQTFQGTQKCFISTCDIQRKYLEINQRCVSTCASGMYIINQTSTLKFQCISANHSCNKYFQNDGMKECYNSCPLVYPFQKDNECLTTCNPYMNDPKSPTLKLCLPSCGGFNPPYILIDENKRTLCTQNCGSMFVQQLGNQLNCVQFCQFYIWDGSSKICTNYCNYYIIDTQLHLISKRCGQSCTDLNMTYNSVDENGLKQCVSKCPNSQPFLNGIICTNNCLFIVQQQITAISQYKCQVNQCEQYSIPYSKNNSVQICVQSCVGNTPYIFGNQCVQNCMLTDNKLVAIDGQTCVKYCFGDAAINVIDTITYCNSDCDFYIEQDTKYCQSIITSKYPYKEIYKYLELNGIITTRYQYVEQCLNKEYVQENGSSICQSCLYYELEGTQHKCVAKCQTSQVQFGYQCFTGICKEIINIGLNIYTNIDNQCVQSCGKLFVSNKIQFKCTELCPSNSVYFIDLGQKVCSQSCADYVTLDPRYTINGIGQCVKNCPLGTFKEQLQAGNIYKQCVSVCSSQQYIIQNEEYICVDECPVYIIESKNIKQCFQNCLDTLDNNISITISENATQCVSGCPSDFPFRSIDDLFCVKSCTSKYYSLVNGVRKCIDTCSTNTSTELNFNIIDHLMCRNECDDSQMFLRIISNIGSCIAECPLHQNFFGDTRECLSECDPKFYRIDGQQKQCMTSCYSPYTYIIIKDDYTQCNQQCQPPTPFSRLDNICTNLCPPQTFLHELVCQLSCPKYMKYALQQDSGQFICSNNCPNKIYSKISDLQVFYCQNSCESPNVFRKDIKTGQIECLIECEPSDYIYSTGECNKNGCIRDPTNKFSLNMVCVPSCPDFVDIQNYNCLSSCEGSFSGYAEQILIGQTVRVCYLDCPTKYVDIRPSTAYKQVGVCSTQCPQTEQLYLQEFSATQFYCTPCQEANQYIQMDLIYCNNTCQSHFFTINDSFNYCVLSCDFPLGRTHVSSLVQCSNCQYYVSEVDQACLAQCDYYNIYNGAQICRMKDNQRNSETCQSFTNNIAPFLCLEACKTFRDGPRCVTDCSITGKRFIPDTGFECQAKCPHFYEYQILFGIEQPRCIATCDFMRSTSDMQECQQTCYSGISIYIFGLAFCSNCSTKLQVEPNYKFSCVNTCSLYESAYACTYIECSPNIIKVNSKQLIGLVCFEQFSYNYTSYIRTISNNQLNIAQIAVSSSQVYILLANGSVLTQNDTLQSGIQLNNVVQIQLVPVAPGFDSQKLLATFTNGTKHTNGVLERTDFTTESVKRIIGFYNSSNTNNSVNFMLTNANIYFRGSCKSGLCTKNQFGNDFDTEFNGKTKFNGMWTKMNLNEFPFTAEDIEDISELDWTIQFKLKNGHKYIYGANQYGRLCKDPKNAIALINVSDYDQIAVGNTTSLFSQGQELYYCGASFDDQPNLNNLQFNSTKLDIQFGGYFGWQFQENTIQSIQAANNGFIIQTTAEIFGIGQCIAFDCYNFNGDQVFYSNEVQKLKWVNKNLIVVGNEKINVQYYQSVLNVQYFNDTKQVESDDTQSQNGTIGIVKVKNTQKIADIKLKVAIGITSSLYVLAVISVFLLVNKIVKDKRGASLTSVRKTDVSQIIKMKQLQESIFTNQEDYQYV